MQSKIGLALIVSLFLISGCATTDQMQRAEVKRISPEELQQLIPSPIATYTLEMLVADSKQGQSNEAIIEKIKTSESRYDLSTAEILDLSQQGVSTEVLAYIQESNELAKQNYLAEEMHKAEKDKAEAIRRLNEERRLQQLRYYDPFWGPRFGMFYGRPLHPLSRFRWGLNYGYPFIW